MSQPDVYPDLEGNIGRRAYELWQQAHPDSELEFPGTLSVMAWLIEEYEGQQDTVTMACQVCGNPCSVGFRWFDRCRQGPEGCFPVQH